MLKPVPLLWVLFFFGGPLLTANGDGSNAPQQDSGSRHNKTVVDVLVLPPEIEAPRMKPKRNKKLKDLVFKGKPVFAELLSKTQRRIVDTAERVFTLKYNSLPVKKSGDMEGSGDSQEVLEVQAFEYLSSIVGRSVRNTLICSTSDGAMFGVKCSREGMSFLKEEEEESDSNEDEENDPLCSPNDPESENDEECKTRGSSIGPEQPSSRSGTFLSPPLKSVFLIQSTSRAAAGVTVRLPLNGDLSRARKMKVWDKKNPTKIILAMFPFEFMKRHYLDRKISNKLAEAYLHKSDGGDNYNIVQILWPQVASMKLNVIHLASKFIQTAKLIARILLRWHKKKSIQLDKVHIIGTSFGAHLAGAVANIIKEKGDGVQIGRITGLDPLGWGFDELDGIGVDENLELTPDDADFVDIIHTSAPDSSFPFVHYGSNEKRGTADFYPNNGRARYCSPTDGLCHHLHSIDLFTSSIEGKSFVGCKCTSWDDFSIRRKCSPCPETTKMGEYVDKNQAKGVYFLATA